MKAIVFGGSGFIGSHVVEQLHIACHKVKVAVRDTSDITFLKKLGVEIVKVDFSNTLAIGRAIDGCEVVYNCTADTNQNAQNSLDAHVEIGLTKTLIDAAVLHGISRFIQLSTIVIYDFNSDDPIDESYVSHPEYLVQKVALERERIIEEAGRKSGLDTVILRPASTIGERDIKSFFSRLFTFYMNDQFPMVGDGEAIVSLIDTRDIGRAMEWLGTYEKPKGDNGVYVLKGFDTTWYDLKREIDQVTGRNAKIVELTKSTPTMMVKNLTVNRIWNDRKIKKLGFETRFSIKDSVEASVRDLLLTEFGI